MKKTLLLISFVFILLVLPVLIKDASAQPPPPPPQDIPIDGGLFLLIAAGAAYGARKLYKQQKEDKELNN
jgi:peptidoglycan/LPS O-acetylase OafA/YrhL